MAREYARVKIKIWADPDFRLLTDGAQSLYFKLVSSPTMNLAGVADWRTKRLAALTGRMTEKVVKQNADELAKANYIVIDDETEEVLVRSFIRHDGIIKTPNIAAAMVKDYAAVASPLLRGVIIHELLRLREDEPNMSGWSVATELLTHPSINPSGMGSGMASANPSGNASHIPHPASRNQQPASPASGAASKTAELAARRARFDEFYSLYPKKAAKGEAKERWDKVVVDIDPGEIIDGLTRLLPWFESQVEGNKDFRPAAGPWLNKQRWLDEPVAAAQVRNPNVPEGW